MISAIVEAATNTARVPWTDDNPNAWDVLKLGPHTFPGTWTISGSCERKLDVKARKGCDAAKVKDEGYQNAELTLEGVVGTSEEFAAMLKILDEINPARLGKARDPYQISHAQAACVNVAAVLVKSVHVPERLADGAVKFVIAVVEWRPEPKKVAKKKPSVKALEVEQRFINAEQTRGRVLTRVTVNEYGDSVETDFVDTGVRMPSSFAAGAMDEPARYITGS